MQTTIKKLEEEVTYKSITTMHTFTVNGKHVRVYLYDKQDMVQSDYENDIDVNEKDLEALTDEECEAFGEDMDSWLSLKVGEEQTITNEE